MYQPQHLPFLITRAEESRTQPIDRYGITVYVDCDPDFVSADIYIDPKDDKGIAIFREFAARMAEHYKSLEA
jgi:hypothetical protein